MKNQEIWRLDASGLMALTRTGAVSAKEATTAALNRLEAVNPQLNAVVETLAETALNTAEALDQARANGAPCGPLHGVPVTIKVNVDQAGCATTNGVVALKNVIAPEDAPVVANLRKAGAIIIGRSNTSEFSFRADTDNPLYGRTHNPWGKHISAGGSSGGAGAAVMAGIGALAHGNDIGGSLRFPAAATGAVSLKPGLGRVPAWNPSQSAERGLLAQNMSVQGLLTRSARDLDLAMPAMIAGDMRDPLHSPLPWQGPPLDGPIRVAFSRETYGYDLHRDVDAALDAALDALRDAGYRVEEVETPSIFEAGRIGYRALMGEVKTLMGRDIKDMGSDTIRQIFDTYFQEFPPLCNSDLLRAMAERSRFMREWNVFLARYPLVLTPFMFKPFFAPDRDTDGRAGVQEVLGEAIYSYAVNFLGLPAACVPARLAQTEKGPQPINVQIIAQRWREDLAVAAAQAIEERLGQMCHPLWETMEAGK